MGWVHAFRNLGSVSSLRILYGSENVGKFKKRARNTKLTHKTICCGFVKRKENPLDQNWSKLNGSAPKHPRAWGQSPLMSQTCSGSSDRKYVGFSVPGLLGYTLQFIFLELHIKELHIKLFLSYIMSLYRGRVLPRL